MKIPISAYFIFFKFMKYNNYSTLAYNYYNERSLTNSNSSNIKVCNSINIEETLTCNNCFNSNINHNMTVKLNWCTYPKFCFNDSQQYNTLICENKCTGTIIKVKDQCTAALSYSVVTIIISFLLLIFCPLFIAFSCLYILVRNCRMYYSKVGFETNDTQPIPLLQVDDVRDTEGRNYRLQHSNHHAHATVARVYCSSVDNYNYEDDIIIAEALSISSSAAAATIHHSLQYTMTTGENNTTSDSLDNNNNNCSNITSTYHTLQSSEILIV